MAEHAMALLTKHMHDDPEYAWGWLCNLAMPIMDATGVSPQIANQAGAHLIHHLFGVDITNHPHWSGEHKSGAQQYAELRIAAEAEEDVASGPAPIPTVTDIKGVGRKGGERPTA